MPKLVTPLTDTQVKNAKPKAKSYKLFDGGGLYVEIMPTGSKLWYMKVRQATGKETRLSFGAYPTVSIADARRNREEAKKLKASGVDPVLAKRLEKRQRAVTGANTFEAIARAWHENKSESWQPGTAKNVLHRLEKDVFPHIGNLPIAEIKAPIILGRVNN